jgi:hypothetical protein
MTPADRELVAAAQPLDEAPTSEQLDAGLKAMRDDGWRLDTDELRHSLALVYRAMAGADAKHAARYLWWRQYAVQGDDCSHDDAFMECETPEQLDALIDAARASSASNQGAAA